jgi:hypothetical protein
VAGKLWFVVWVLLVAGDPAQVGAVLLHLIREGLLRATEFSCDGTVGDALRVILPKLDDGIGLRIKLTQSAKSCSSSMRSAMTSSIGLLRSGI